MVLPVATPLRAVLDAEASLLEAAFALTDLLFVTCHHQRRYAEERGGIAVTFLDEAGQLQQGRLTGVAHRGGHAERATGERAVAETPAVPGEHPEALAERQHLVEPHRMAATGTVGEHHHRPVIVLAAGGELVVDRLAFALDAAALQQGRRGVRGHGRAA